MSHRLLEKARRRLAAESGCRANPWGGRLAVALIYPNTYHQAMSNLGFLSVYQLINARPDALCERFFLPDPDDLAEHRKTGFPLFSLESGRPLTDFDLIAFSISFENDYLHLPVICDLARIPLLAAERGEQFPPLLAGGVCTFLNPEPLAEIIDLFAIGEAEAILPALLPALAAELPRGELLRRCATLPGVYVPSLYQVDYRADGTIAGFRAEAGAPPRVSRQWLTDLDAADSRSFILTEETEFADMALIEVSRGCSRGCRFCAAGFLYLPPRERSLENLKGQVADGLCRREKIGLVGAAVADYPHYGELADDILAQGGKVSVASLRLDALGRAEVQVLKASGHKTVSLAPEAGSQRLRDLINKGLDEEQIIEAARLLADEGIPNLKLYFLIGLPTEEMADIEELLALTGRLRQVWVAAQKKFGRVGALTLSVNPFIPKPFTPLQWAGMEADKSLAPKVRRLRAAVGRLGNTTLLVEPSRSAILQALLSRGDRRVGRLLPLLAGGSNLNAACRQAGLDPDFYVTRERGETEILPWEILDSGVSRSYLRSEYRRALEGRLTPRCAQDCRRCGVCG
ncbi:MAG: radical SAM protein [Desulfuromonadales bacterium]|nr:radical SAM protein [Desulfuromonadales bacterium]